MWVCNVKYLWLWRSVKTRSYLGRGGWTWSYRAVGITNKRRRRRRRIREDRGGGWSRFARDSRYRGHATLENIAPLRCPIFRRTHNPLNDDFPFALSLSRQGVRGGSERLEMPSYGAACIIRHISKRGLEKFCCILQSVEPFPKFD